MGPHDITIKEQFFEDLIFIKAISSASSQSTITFAIHIGDKKNFTAQLRRYITLFSKQKQNKTKYKNEKILKAYPAQACPH